MPAIEPVTRYFGGPGRTLRSGLRAELTLDGTTAVSARPDVENGQGLIKLGSLQIMGPLDDLEVAAAAFSYAVEVLTGPTSTPVEERSDPTEATLCLACEVPHSRATACTSSGRDLLRAAIYTLMERTHMLSKKQARLLVDSAALWIAQKDTVSAMMLLHMFVLDDLALTICDMLADLEMRQPGA